MSAKFLKCALPALLFFMAAGASAHAQGLFATDPDIVAEAYLAPANKDGEAGEPAKAFVTTDIPIFCYIRLSAVQVAEVKLNLVAAKVAGVKPETQVVSTTYTTRDGEDRVFFTGRPQGKWVPGDYRADIFVGGVLIRSLEFNIGNPVGNPTTVTAIPKKPKSAPQRRPTNRRP